MPIVSRSRLRLRLGRDFLRDTLVGTITASQGPGGSLAIIDSTQANVAFSGEDQYVRSWVRVNGMTLRTATFNVGSGAFISLQTAATGAPTGGTYEVHELLGPEEKDRALDMAISQVWQRREVGIPGVDGLLAYSLSADVGEVFDAYSFANPTGSLNRDRRDFAQYAVVVTGSGRELRISAALTASAQLILDAQVAATLGSGDAATVNIPDEDWILTGAAARCYEMLSRRAPGEETKYYHLEAARHGRAWAVGLARYRPQVDRTIEFDTPVGGRW